MAVLKPKEYDISYFDGKNARYSHNAGYSKYERWYRNTGPNSLGEFWKDEAQYWVNKLDLKGKKFLDIGCAKGFLVKDLRDMGVDAYGLDVSQYAVENCEPEVAPYLTIGDARYSLSNYKDNEFDLVYSRWFLGCINDANLPKLIKEMNRISKLQLHVVSEDILPQFYNRKPLKDWLAMNFNKGTILVKSDNFNRIYRK